MEQPNKEARTVQRRARGLQRIASILDAAEVIFAERGYEEATTNHIAALAGISPGSLYQFFSNKEEIAQALAARYSEELERVYSKVFSVEAATLPLAAWLDQAIDALVAFHLAHPAFLILFSSASPFLRRTTNPTAGERSQEKPATADNTPMVQLADLTRALQEGLQVRFDSGFQLRAPDLAPTQRRLSARLSVLIFKATLLPLLQAEETEREMLVRELKSVLYRYLAPLF